MDAFANVDDLQSHYRLMDAQEVSRASHLLTFTTAKMLTFMGQHSVEVDKNDEVQAELLKGICCAVVRRALESPESESTIDAWGGSAVYAPAGDIYFTSAEKREMLGTKAKQRIWSICPKVSFDE